MHLVKQDLPLAAAAGRWIAQCAQKVTQNCQNIMGTCLVEQDLAPAEELDGQVHKHRKEGRVEVARAAQQQPIQSPPIVLHALPALNVSCAGSTPIEQE